MSGCSKVAQKDYKTRHDWVGKLTHCKLYKKLKLEYSNKSYIHNPESIQENETDKLHWDFEIQTDHLISARRPDLVIVKKTKQKEKAKKRTCSLVDFAVPADY